MGGRRDNPNTCQRGKRPKYDTTSLPMEPLAPTISRAGTSYPRGKCVSITVGQHFCNVILEREIQSFWRVPPKGPSGSNQLASGSPSRHYTSSALIPIP